MILNVISSQEGFKKIKKEWDELFNSCDGLTIFSDFCWNYSWWDVVGKRNPLLSLHILHFRSKENGETTAIIPLMKDESKDFNNLQSLTYPFADYYDFLIRSEYYEVCIELFSNYLVANTIKLDLFSICETSKTLVIFKNHRLFTLGSHTKIIKTRSCPVTDLTDEHFFKRITGKKTTRLKFNRLNRAGVLSTCHFVDYPSIVKDFDFFVHQHTKRWEDNPEAVGLFTDGLTLDFFLEITKQMTVNNYVILSTLRFDDEPIAYIFGFIHRYVYYFYRMAFDLQFWEYSPGHLLLKEVLKYCKENDIYTFDFLRGEYNFKRRYSNKLLQNYNVHVEI